MSVIVCECDKDKVACSRHFRQMCNCPRDKKKILGKFILSHSGAVLFLKSIVIALSANLAWFSNAQLGDLSARMRRDLKQCRIQSVYESGRADVYPVGGAKASDDEAAQYAICSAEVFANY